MNPFHGDQRTLAAVLIIAAILRAGVLWQWHTHLSDDRDAYLGIGRSLVDGEGYSNPGTGRPTAYRPPLYPIVLSVLIRSGHTPVALALLHLVLGLGTIMLTFRLGRQLGLHDSSLLAAGFVAVDPLLLYYTTFPMTETLATFLTVLLLVSMGCLSTSGRLQPGSNGTGEAEIHAEERLASTTALGSSWPQQVAVGCVFGLSVLCRPTIWVFGLLAAAYWICNTVRAGIDRSFVRQIPWATLLSAAVVVSPWLIRNLVVLGHPVLTTTHGGYTLLLGNNPVFYDEVVTKSWGTVWEHAPAGRTQADWYRQLEREMKDDLGPRFDEVTRDRWMYSRAFDNIAEQPGDFVRACWLRFLRFWNVAPLGPVRGSAPGVVYWMVAAFYVVQALGLILGLVKVAKARRPAWMPLILLLLCLTAVHLVFWSNTRMRSSLIPAIAVLSAYGLTGHATNAAATASGTRPVA